MALNANVDIFWVLPGGENYECHYGMSDLRSIKKCLRRIALPAHEWFLHQLWDDLYKTLFSFLTDKGVEEFFIIVSSDKRREAAMSFANKAFTEPHRPPHMALHVDDLRCWAEVPGLEANCDRKLSWATVEGCATKAYREFQENFHEARMNGEVSMYICLESVKLC